MGVQSHDKMPGLPPALQNSAIFRLAEARALGLHPEQVRRLTRRGELTRLGRGLYSPASAAPTEHHTLAEVAKRVPKGVVCLLTALRFYAIGSQHPREVWLAVDRRAGIPRIDVAPVRVVRISGEALVVGIDEHLVEGVPIRITSPASVVRPK